MDGVRIESTPNSLDQLVTIELFGQPYTFKAEAGSLRAKEVAEFLVNEVNKVAEQIAQKTSTTTKQTILILAALNIAKESFELKKNHMDFLQHISEKSARLIQILDACEHQIDKIGIPG